MKSLLICTLIVFVSPIFGCSYIFPPDGAELFARQKACYEVGEKARIEREGKDKEAFELMRCYSRKFHTCIAAYRIYVGDMKSTSLSLSVQDLFTKGQIFYKNYGPEATDEFRKKEKLIPSEFCSSDETLENAI